MASNSLVGFIGLGNMGGHMARNLLSKGHSLVVYDVYPEVMAALVEAGAVATHSPGEVAEKTNRIVTMLPNSPNVVEAYLGANGILSAAKPGTLLLDSSTIDPSTSKDIATEAKKKNVVYMDAPVSGGVNVAKAGNLTFMVGGDAKDFTTAKALLECMGKNIVHCGVVGTGQAAKICNNMLLAIGMIGTSETINLGKRLGLDPKLLSQILNTSSGRCWSSEVYNPVPGLLEGVPSNNDYQGGFSTALMTKDLGLAQNAATKTTSPTPLGSMCHQIYRIMCQKGFSNKDFSYIYQFLQENNK